MEAKHNLGKKFKLEFEITEVGDNGVVDEWEYHYKIKCKGLKDSFGSDLELLIPIKNLDKFLKKKVKKTGWNKKPNKVNTFSGVYS